MTNARGSSGKSAAEYEREATIRDEMIASLRREAQGMRELLSGEARTKEALADAVATFERLMAESESEETRRAARGALTRIGRTRGFDVFTALEGIAASLGGPREGEPFLALYFDDDKWAATVEAMNGALDGQPAPTMRDAVEMAHAAARELLG